jgi:hypothetical protein
MNQTLLHDLLDANLAFGPEYGAALSNHLPMALHALAELGADGQRLRRCFDYYARAHALPALPAGGRVLADWRSALGDIHAYADLRASFDALLATGGLAATLRAALPLLWPGALGAAFHGLIRTGHAVQSDHVGEQAAALAYWAARWQAAPMVSAPQTDAPLPFAEWAAGVEIAARQQRLPGRLISERAGLALFTDAYAVWSTAVVVEGWAPLADWAADLYARSGNFTVLHIATAARAARVLAPWTSDAAAVRRGFVRAATAAVLASGLPPQADRPSADAAVEWHTVRAAAIESDDEHVIKLVHTLDEERAVYGDGARLQAAARALD